MSCSSIAIAAVQPAIQTHNHRFGWHETHELEGLSISARLVRRESERHGATRRPVAVFSSTIVPQTSFVGAVLLTGYLGGAIATHVRVGDPLLTHTLFPIYVGVFVWIGLLLRDERLRAFVKSRH